MTLLNPSVHLFKILNSNLIFWTSELVMQISNPPRLQTNPQIIITAKSKIHVFIQNDHGSSYVATKFSNRNGIVQQAINSLLQNIPTTPLICHN